MAAQSFSSILFVSMVTLVGCGGSKPPTAKSTEPEQAVAAEPTADKEDPHPDCSDGTCIVCGDAQCPKGFFCDESSAKPACQWVPTCTDSVSCSCVERTLAGKCTCTEREGGTYVRCAD